MDVRVRARVYDGNEDYQDVADWAREALRIMDERK